MELLSQESTRILFTSLVMFIGVFLGYKFMTGGIALSSKFPFVAFPLTTVGQLLLEVSERMKQEDTALMERLGLISDSSTAKLILGVIRNKPVIKLQVEGFLEACKDVYSQTELQDHVMDFVKEVRAQDLYTAPSGSLFAGMEKLSPNYKAPLLYCVVPYFETFYCSPKDALFVGPKTKKITTMFYETDFKDFHKIEGLFIYFKLKDDGELDLSEAYVDPGILNKFLVFNWNHIYKALDTGVLKTVYPGSRKYPLIQILRQIPNVKLRTNKRMMLLNGNIPTEKFSKEMFDGLLAKLYEWEQVKKVEVTT